MRTYDVIVSLGLIGLALGLVGPAVSFDGTPEPLLNGAPSAPQRNAMPPNAVQREGLSALPPPPAVRAIPPPGAEARAVPVPPAALGATPGPFEGPCSRYEALRSGTQMLRDGKTDEGLTALEYAARQGAPGALWKLGKIFAEGDGVDKNMLRSFEYYRDLTVGHAYDPPNTAQARFVASAFVALGHFYLDGIPDTYVKPDPARARAMYNYAASYFADPDAQYNLARLFREGTGGPKDPRQAVKWLGLAANKGQHQAQATLGAMLFSGKEVSRQAALGLFWLTVAKDSAGAGERWVTETQAAAFAQANDDERALAYRYLENWVRDRRR
jgi:hypothetical protein